MWRAQGCYRSWKGIEAGRAKGVTLSRAVIVSPMRVFESIGQHRCWNTTVMYREVIVGWLLLTWLDCSLGHYQRDIYMHLIALSAIARYGNTFALMFPDSSNNKHLKQPKRLQNAAKSRKGFTCVWTLTLASYARTKISWLWRCGVLFPIWVKCSLPQYLYVRSLCISHYDQSILISMAHIVSVTR